MSQSGSAFWTCTQCGGMGSALDSQCPNCGAARPKSPAASVPPARTRPTPSWTPPPTPTPTSASIQSSVPITSAQPWTQRTCAHCGSTQTVWSWRCTQCANRLSYGPRTSVAPPNRAVAIALAFVLGFLGVHHWYMGRRALFYVSVALSWSGLTSMISVMDGFRMLFMTDEAFLAECA